MREILFRGKCLDTGEWVEGFFSGETCDGPFSPMYEQANIIKKGSGWWAPVDPATVGQFTGLLDKNYKRIFEGDIVEYNDGYDYFKGEVVFEYGAFGVGSYKVIGLSSGCCDNFANLWQLFWDQEATDGSELFYCTVIGNIHDNPELLEGGDDHGT